MKSFQVWLSPLGATCKVRVDGITNANWLLHRLRQSFAFQSSEPVIDEEGSSCCTFRMTYSTQRYYRTFERLLSAIPEVKWTPDPAREADSKKEVPASTTRLKAASKVRRSIKVSPSNKTTVVLGWLLSRLSRAVATMF